MAPVSLPFSCTQMGAQIIIVRPFDIKIQPSASPFSPPQVHIDSRSHKQRSATGKLPQATSAKPLLLLAVFRLPAKSSLQRESLRLAEYLAE